MAKRRIIHAERINNGRITNATFITLDCKHKRSLGGHVLDGRVFLPSDMLRRAYDCREDFCGNIAYKD